jgi:hypothetical protein
MNRKLFSSLRMASLGALWLCWGQSAPAEWKKMGDTYHRDGKEVAFYPVFGDERAPIALSQDYISSGMRFRDDPDLSSEDRRDPDKVRANRAWFYSPEEVREWLWRLGVVSREGKGSRLHARCDGRLCVASGRWLSYGWGP